MEQHTNKKYKHDEIQKDKIQIAKIQMQQQTNACATIFAGVTFVHALVYCNFLREVRLGGWGTEGPKVLILDQYVTSVFSPFR